MKTAEQLYSYDAFFPEEIVEDVIGVAKWQASFGHYTKMFEKIGIPDVDAIKRKGIVDIRAEEEEDEVLVYHSPMNVPLDANQLFQIATLAKANPTKRLIAQGNAGGRGYYAKSLSLAEQKKVSGGNLKPLVEPVLRYLDWQGVTEAQHAGYSLGAALAAVATAHGEQTVERSVHIEPPSVIKRHLGELVVGFLESGKQLDTYVEASGSTNFKQARQGGSMALYLLSLLAPSNIAIGRGLAQGKFGDDLGKALAAQPNLQATIISGDNSELVPQLSTHDMVVRLRNENGLERVKHLRLPGQTHSLTNDIYLNAVLVRLGLL